MNATNTITPPVAASASDPRTQRRVGVVFVHGVGEQKQSSTIREQGGPLLDWIWGWHDARGLPADQRLQPEWAKLSYGAPLKGPARFSIHLPAYERAAFADEGPPTTKRWAPATWVLAEGWWASRLEAPSMSSLLVWSFGILIRFWVGLWNEAFRRTRERFEHRTAGGAVLGVFWERVGNVLLVGAEMAIAALSYPLLILLLLIAQIPIDQLQKFVLLTLIRPLLVDRIGDFWIYLHDYPGAMHIRRGVEAAIDALASDDNCDEIVVVAHSQGAVVAFDALTGGGIAHLDRIHRFITIGGALNKAWTLEEGIKALNAPLPSTVKRWVDMWANYDPVPGGPLVKPFSVLKSERLTNGMNVLTDHDTYWHNPEEFLSRLAQEIDAPDDHGPLDRPTSSRFWPGNDRQKELVERRANRVHALVFWRCAAFFLFAAAVVDRIRMTVGPGRFPGLDRLSLDGRAMWSGVRAMPGFDTLIKPVEAIGAWVDRIVANAGLVFEPLGMALVAVIGFGLLVGLGYLGAGLAVYRAWDTRERDDVARPPGTWLTAAGRDLWWRIPAGVGLVAIPAVLIRHWP
jgi:hypothetical protein